MLTIIPWNYLFATMAFIVISAATCMIQIGIRKKWNILALCKVFVFLPLFYLLIKVTTSVSQAYSDTTVSNELSQSVINHGLAVTFACLSLGFLITFILALVYAITKFICDNQKI